MLPKYCIAQLCNTVLNKGIIEHTNHTVPYHLFLVNLLDPGPVMMCWACHRSSHDVLGMPCSMPHYSSYLSRLISNRRVKDGPFLKMFCFEMTTSKGQTATTNCLLLAKQKATTGPFLSLSDRRTIYRMTDFQNLYYSSTVLLPSNEIDMVEVLLVLASSAN